MARSLRALCGMPCRIPSRVVIVLVVFGVALLMLAAGGILDEPRVAALGALHPRQGRLVRLDRADPLGAEPPQGHHNTHIFIDAHESNAATEFGAPCTVGDAFRDGPPEASCCHAALLARVGC